MSAQNYQPTNAGQGYQGIPPFPRKGLPFWTSIATLAATAVIALGLGGKCGCYAVTGNPAYLRSTGDALQPEGRRNPVEQVVGVPENRSLENSVSNTATGNQNSK